MAIDIVVPNLGESITEATLVAWRKKPGDSVLVDEVLLELETDKVTLEIPAPNAGVLSEVLVAAGTDVKVGALLGRLEETAVAPMVNQDALQFPGQAGAPARPAPEGRYASSGSGRGELTPASPGSSAAPVRLDPEKIARSGEGGGVTVDDLQSFLQQAAREVVERSGPAVRKLIAESRLDPGQIPASGRDGRLTKEDVLAFVAGKKDAPVQENTPAGAGREERVRMSRLRRTIATRLKEVQNTAAILTTFNEADMSAAVDLRKRYRDTFETRHGVRLGFMSFFVKAVVTALQEMPQVNASIEGDEVVYKHYYDIGIAVSTDVGLKVPVVRAADTKGFAEIETEIAALAEQARDGSLTLEQMAGGTFSITNGGVFGSLLSTPILNAPQSAILGLHKIQDRPVAIEGQVQIRPMMYLALSYDHRVIDGRESVRFLVRVKELIENPERLLLNV